MLSAYDKIKSDHLQILALLREMSALFRSVPIEKVKEPRIKSASAPAAQTEQVDNVELSTWEHLPRALELCALFSSHMEAHFQLERQVIFTGMLMGMPTKQISLWVLRREFEHGQICEQAYALRRIFCLINPPIERKWAIEIEEYFERMRTLLLQHSVEEDSKIDMVLRQNPEVSKQVKKLCAEYKGMLPSGSQFRAAGAVIL